MLALIKELLLTVFALAPAVFLCVFIYIKDKTEKEPVNLLIRLFVLGIAIIYPCVLFEKLFGRINALVFSPFVINPETGEHLYAVEPVYQFAEAFFVVALVEEGFKWLALRIGTNNQRDFNSFFDGIIYSVFVSLGFAAFENVQYVSIYGFKTALTRAVLSVPAHMFFSVFMGYFFSLHIIDVKAIRSEKLLKSKALLPEGTNRMAFSFSGPLSLILPVLIHGLYDFCLFYYNIVTLLIFVALMTFLYIFCFRKINKVSASDHSHGSIIKKMLAEKYPHLNEQ